MEGGGGGGVMLGWPAPAQNHAGSRQLNDRKLSAQLMLSYGSGLDRRGEKQKILCNFSSVTDRERGDTRTD